MPAEYVPTGTVWAVVALLTATTYSTRCWRSRRLNANTPGPFAA